MLLEAPFDPIRRQMNSVLLTVDLTKAVADEAIERKDCVVVAYRTYRFDKAKNVLQLTQSGRSYYLQGIESSHSCGLSAAITASPSA